MQPKGAFAVAMGVVLCTAALLGCGSEPTRQTPAGALELFLDAMKRSGRDRSALQEAFALLSPSAREALDERARLATSLAGRDFEPWEMLTQGRFRLKFTPVRMDATIEGEHATVVVEGAEPGQRAEVPMVSEEGAWCVDLRIGE